MITGRDGFIGYLLYHDLYLNIKSIVDVNYLNIDYKYAK